MPDQREFLAVLDWVLAAPERWDLVVSMAMCPRCCAGTGACEEHREAFRALNGKGEVEA